MNGGQRNKCYKYTSVSKLLVNHLNHMETVRDSTKAT